MQEKEDKEEEEKKYLTVEKNEYISNIDLKCAKYKKEVAVPDDESELKRWMFQKKNMKAMKQFLQQWSQEEISFYYQEIKQK